MDVHNDNLVGGNSTRGNWYIVLYQGFGRKCGIQPDSDNCDVRQRYNIIVSTYVIYQPFLYIFFFAAVRLHYIFLTYCIITSKHRETTRPLWAQSIKFERAIITYYYCYYYYLPRVVCQLTDGSPSKTLRVV